MSRFGEEQHPLFRRINSSIGFDMRLAPFDVEVVARPRAGAEPRSACLDDDELGAAPGRARHRRGRGPERQLRAERRRRGRPHGDRAPADRAGRPARRQAPHRPLAQRPGRDRPGAAGPLAHGAGGRAARVAARRRCSSWPRSTSTGRRPPTPTCSAPSPSTSGHHLLAYWWMFFRDMRRFYLVAESTSDMPAGSGALAGLNWDLDRDGLASELGFERPHPNSLDAVSNRDFALDYLYAASVCAMHLSRLGSEIVIWSSQEFGFCRGRRLLLLGLVDHAPEEEPRRRRAAARQGAAGQLVADEPARHDARACRSPTARTCRRTRSRSSTRSTPSSSASRRPA